MKLIELTHPDPTHLDNLELDELEYQIEDAIITLKELRDCVENERQQRQW